MIENKHRAVFIYPEIPGEFGWEVMQWQGFVRRQAKAFSDVLICCRKDSWPLYQDIPNAKLTPYSASADNENAEKYLWKKDQIIPHNQQAFIVYGVEKTEHPFDVLFHARNAKHQEKNYPIEMWNKLSKTLLDAGYTVASIGKSAHHVEHTYDLTGQSLDALFDYMRTAKCIIGPSSGPIHLASLCGCPQVVWGDERIYVGGDTLETRYKTSWNPFNVPVEYIMTKWDSPDRWKPTPEAIVERVKMFLEKRRQASKPKTHSENIIALQVALNQALGGGSFLIDVHRKTSDMRAEYKHFSVNKNFTDADIKHCRGHLKGELTGDKGWK